MRDGNLYYDDNNERRCKATKGWLDGIVEKKTRQKWRYFPTIIIHNLLPNKEKATDDSTARY